LRRRLSPRGCEGSITLDTKLVVTVGDLAYRGARPTAPGAM
jgi:hypothetical protein